MARATNPISKPRPMKGPPRPDDQAMLYKLSVRITDRMRARLLRQVKLEGTSISAIVERCLNKGLSDGA